jgi:hypothetical protein
MFSPWSILRAAYGNGMQDDHSKKLKLGKQKAEMGHVMRDA